MNEQIIDSLTRRVADGISRRDSIFALGGAGLAALSGLATAEARKKHKRKKDKKKSDKKCKRQKDECNGVFAPLCADPDAPEDCLELTSACCAFLGDCKAAAFLDCFFALLGITEAPV
jgi:hypothetical protein